MAFADVLGTKMFYESVGEGEPVVMVHGGFIDHNVWVFTAPILAERFRVVAIDLPGHSHSGGSLETAVTPLEVMNLTADYIIALVEDLDLGPAHFVGQSFGGGALLHLLVRRPDLVRSMSLHEPATVALGEEEFAAERELQSRAMSLLVDGDVERGMAAFIASVGGDWDAFPESSKAMMRHNARNFAGPTFISDPALAVPAGLESVRHPVQFTKGEESPRFFHASIDRVAARMPNAEVVTISGGHAAMLTQPVEYAAAVTKFIDRAEVGARAL